MLHLASLPLRWIFSVFLLLLFSLVVIVSPLFEDASGASDFGSSLSINAPWTGNSFGDFRLIDLDADGVDEILVGGTQLTCSSTMDQLSLFRRDPAKNQYIQLNYGQGGVFLGLNFVAFFFEALGRTGSVLPDIIACQFSLSRLAVLENHGGLNFSISAVAFSSVVACSGNPIVLAVADTDRDGSDEVFSSSQISTDFFTRLPNTTLVSVLSRFPGLPTLQRPGGAFADLDDDSYLDLIWTGSSGSTYYTYIFRNVGGNFSSVVNSIDGVQYGSIAVAEFTGDGRDDIVVSGQLANGSSSISLYENSGSMSFVRRFDAGFLVTSSIKYLIAAVPLRSQAAALDLVVVPSTSSFFSNASVYVNEGSGIFAPIAAPWLPKSFVGAVVRGPDIGANPSFLAMGQTNSVSYDGSTLVGYMDNSTLISYASNLFENAKRAVSLLNGVVSAADFNYDGCTDAFLSGYSAASYSLKSALLAGDCSGSLRIQSVGLPAIFESAAVVRDFDHDGRLDYFASGTGVGAVLLYYRFNLGGIPENISFMLPPLLGLQSSVISAGAASGSNFDDIYYSGLNSGTLHYFLRNARNGSFILATADIFGMVPVSYGSCAFAAGAGGSNASMWMDIFSVGLSATGIVFNYMMNNRNGSFTNLVNSSASFPGGVPIGCKLSSMVAADLNGDGRDDLFYNGFNNPLFLSRLYLRDANGSMILSPGLGATGNLTQLWYSSTVAVDIDSDGDLDVVVAGENAAAADTMAALLNDGSGIFTDGTALVFGSLPGFSRGALTVAQLTNDPMPDLIHIGHGDFCGPRVLLQRSNTTASSSSTSSSSLPPLASGSSSLASALTSGGLCVLFLLCACF